MENTNKNTEILANEDIEAIGHEEFAKRIQEQIAKEEDIKNKFRKEVENKIYTCKNCEIEKEGKDFYINKNNKLDKTCKYCRIILTKERELKRIREGLSW